MYLRKAVPDHLPIRMIEKTGTPARYMAIAAPERMDLVPISDLRMPSFVSPIGTTQVCEHLPCFIDDLALVLNEGYWRIFACALVRTDSPY